MNRELLERVPNGRGLLVSLYYLPDNALTPYVTWMSNTEEPEKTYWGNYFQTREEAEEDFDRRSFRGEAGLYDAIEKLGGSQKDYLELLKEFRGF